MEEERTSFRLYFFIFLFLLSGCVSNDDMAGTYVGNFKKLKDTIIIVNDSLYTRVVYDEHNRLIFKQSNRVRRSKDFNNKINFHGLNYIVINPEGLSNVDDTGSITMVKEGFLTVRLRTSDEIYYEKVK